MKNNFLIVLFLISIILSSQEKSRYSLQEAIDTALKNNVNIKKAAIDLKIADAKVWETKAAGLPQISGSFGYNYFLDEQEQVFPASFSGNSNATGLVTIGTGIKQSMSAGATLSQLLFNGSYLVGLQSVKVYKMISELAKQKTEKGVKEAVQYAYSSVVVADENSRILNENLKISDKNLHDISEIYKVGLGEEQSVDQMKYNHSSLNMAIKNTEESKKALLNSLKYLLGISIDSKIELSTTLDELISKNTSLVDDISEKSLENHIDLKIAENEVKSNKLQVKNEQSKYLPTVAAFLTDTYSAFSDTFEWNGGKYWNNTAIVGLSVEIPIFSSFSRKSKVEQAKLNLEKSEIDQLDLKQNLVKEAQNKKIDYENALSKFNNTKELIALSDKIFKKEQIKFYEGIGNSSDLSIAEKQKYDAQSQYIDASFQLIQSKIALDKALDKL